MKKFLFIVGDGMADRKSEMRSYTPLEWANTPNMDYIAMEGINGLLNAIAPGVTPGSAEAHLSMFGYDINKITNGRGFFEALGAGMSPIIGDIAFRCNFATINKDFDGWCDSSEIEGYEWLDKVNGYEYFEIRQY